jgi:hypothetical protein
VEANRGQSGPYVKPQHRDSRLAPVHSATSLEAHLFSGLVFYNNETTTGEEPHFSTTTIRNYWLSQQGS